MHEDDSACPQPQPQPQRRARGLLVYIVVAVLAAAAGVGTTFAVHSINGAPSAPLPLPRTQNSMNDSAVYDEVEPSVVDVSANLQYLDETAEGTGFVIDAADGLVLTNNHVIDGATSVTVTPVTTGKSYPAVVVGYDLAADVAVLRIKDAAGLRAVTIGDSDGLAIGTQVLALGNEAGQGGPPTVAPGVISSLNRSIVASDQSSGLTETLHGMLQTSADIRPGDSGGPLANAAGQVVGIDTAAGNGGPSAGFAGYAIPINAALAAASQITGRRGGPSIQLGMPAFLGVLLPDSASGDPRQQASQARNGTSNSTRGCLAGNTSTYTAVPATIAPVRSGALVDGVVCGTPAAQAGLEAGDVITSFGGRAVGSSRSLSGFLRGDRPGQAAKLAWVAIDGTQHEAQVTLSVGPAG